MDPRIQIFLFNLWWNFMKVAMFIYTNVFHSSINKILLLLDKINNYLSNDNTHIFVVENSIVYYINRSNYKKETHKYIVYRETSDDKKLMVLTNNDNRNNQPLEKCGFEFIMVIIKCNDKTYDITNILKNPIHYYYVNDSILFDNNFMEWINLYHLKSNLDNSEIVIMDNNIKEMTLSSGQYIHLNKNSYKIIDKNKLELNK